MGKNARPKTNKAYFVLETMCKNSMSPKSFFYIKYNLLKDGFSLCNNHKPFRMDVYSFSVSVFQKNY